MGAVLIEIARHYLGFIDRWIECIQKEHIPKQTRGKTKAILKRMFPFSPVQLWSYLYNCAHLRAWAHVVNNNNNNLFKQSPNIGT